MEKIKKIRVFLSCPNDLVEDIDIVTVVDDILNEGNSYFEDLNGVRFELKHWQRDVYLGEGKPRVQDRINESVWFQRVIFISVSCGPDMEPLQELMQMVRFLVLEQRKNLILHARFRGQASFPVPFYVSTHRPRSPIFKI
jgi:hypothetical protein